MVKIRKYFLIFLGLVLIIFSATFGWFYYQQFIAWKIGIDFSCIEIEKRKIIGRSMEPLLAEGTQVKVLVGYYECNSVGRNQIVILQFRGRKETFVKKIIGLPGDKLEFQENQVKLNGKILKNSASKPYLFSEASQRIINIPLRDGKIPPGRYFVLSEEKGPTAFDSRQYGFVEREHLKGRVIIK